LLTRLYTKIKIVVLVSFQSIVEEMLRLKNGGSVRKAGEKTTIRDYAFKRADGTEMTVPVRTSACSKVEMSNYTKKVIFMLPLLVFRKRNESVVKNLKWIYF